LGLHQRGSRGRGCARRRVAGPDQDIAPLIDRQALALNEFILQIVQGRVVELKLALQGAVGQTPPALEHGDRLVEDLLTSHCPPFLNRCAVQQMVVGIGKAMRTLLYPREVTKESKNSWERVTQQ